MLKNQVFPTFPRHVIDFSAVLCYNSDTLRAKYRKGRAAWPFEKCGYFDWRYMQMIEFTDVVKSYEQGNKALNGVTMQIDDGEFCFLVGPSGSGKSTIIKLITGELRPTSGTVKVSPGASG